MLHDWIPALLLVVTSLARQSDWRVAAQYSTPSESGGTRELEIFGLGDHAAMFYDRPVLFGVGE